MKNTQNAYLDKLKFDKKLNDSIWSFFIDRTRFTWLVIIIIIIAWTIWLKSLPLESNPAINIWIAFVQTVLPWASPENIEDLVSKKIEKQIAKVKWIDTMTSVSMNGVSLISVQFRSDVDIDSTMRELKDNVDLAKLELPTDTKDSIVKEVSFDDTPIWTFSISWKYNDFELYDFAKIIRDEIEKDTLVSEVNISWWSEKEYGVFVDPKALENYNLSLDSINSAIKAQNFTIPIWDLDVGSYKHSISVDTRYYTLENLKNVVVSKVWDTWIVYLKDIAKIEDSPKKITSISRLSVSWSEPLSAITLSVVKKRWGSIVDLVDNWNISLKRLKDLKLIPNDLKIKTIVDQSERIKLDLSHLTRDWIITIMLVFITLFLVIWIKEALVAWVAAPIVFFITFAVMAIADQTLNFLSLFALILSLWLLVDDAIVVVSAINQYKASGKFSTREAALLVLRDYKKVLITTTLTVVWIFSAMLFMTWIIWKFIFSIPFVITITLLASLFVALTINPALAVIFSWRDSYVADISIKRQSKWKQILNKWIISIKPLENAFHNKISYLLEHPSRARKFLLFTLVLFISALLLPISWILKSDFFPKTDADTFFINIEAEAGTKLESTLDITKDVEKILMKINQIDSFATSVWWLANTWKSTWWSNISASNYANITVNLIKKEYGRDLSSLVIVEKLRKDLLKIKAVKVTVVEWSSWPPAWWDFELKISWEDFKIIDKISSDVRNVLLKVPWAVNIDISRKPLPFEFSIALDPVKLSLYNITIPQVSSFLKSSVDWVDATKIFKASDEIIVRTKLDSDYTDSLDKIKELTIKNNLWQNVILRDLFKADFRASVFSISRLDQKRVVTITAAAASWYTWKQLKAEFDKKMKNYKMPVWYEFITGWTNEENAKSVNSLLVALLFGMIFIVATLVLLYDSFIQSILVMVTIPLSLIWVFAWLTLFWQPLSFPWLIWLVALFGIVVRNGIILFDKINLNLKENIEFKEAIIEAGTSRLEPVFLTSVCTVLGMIPLTLSNPTWTSLWLSIIFGLSVSTFFTLFVLPSLYYMVFRKKYK